MNQRFQGPPREVTVRWWSFDARFPWLEVLSSARASPLPWRVRDSRTNEQAIVRSQADLQHFVAAHSSAQGHGGLGDLVRGVTKFLGIGSSCEPCAKRQAALNRIAPRVYRR